MYKFSNKLRTLSFALMAIGLVGWLAAYMTTPKSIEEVKKALHDAHNAHGAHGSAHGNDAKTHKVDATHSENTKHNAHGEAKGHSEENHTETSHSDAKAHTTDAAHKTTTEVKEVVDKVKAEASSKKTEVIEVIETEVKKAHGPSAVETMVAGGGGAGHAVSHEDAHAEHVFHAQQNRPWSALYVALFYFMIIALGALAFYAINNAAQAGWPIVLFRVMEAVASYLPIGAVLLFVFLVLSSVGHMNHVFAWMDPALIDPTSPKYDELIANKSSYLNIPFFLIRAAIYIAGWVWYQRYTRKQSIAQDNGTDNTNYKKIFKASAAFLVFFLITESMMSWDWIMSLDPHWFSTLFGWYIFAGMMVCAITTIALITIYLKSRGYLEYVNDSHLHDLAKFMFGFSIFWTYLWFSQFMLIWYANIPEEVTYFITRFNDYKVPFLGMLGLNFVFPLLLLMNSDYKRVPWFIVLTGIVILIGHYINVYVMIMPATVGDQWFIGLPEVSAMLLLLGLFIYVVFTALTKAPLLAKRNPFIHESEQYHY